MSASTPPDVSRQWAEIQGLFAYWKSISAWLTPILTFLPLSALWFDFLSCPRFEKYQPVIATVGAILAVAFLYYVFRERDADTIYWWAVVCFVIGAVCALAYIVVLFLVVANVDDERYLMGFSLSTRAQTAIQNNDIKSHSPKALLGYFGFDSEDDIWSDRWLAGVSLFFTSTATFSLLAGAFFLFTLRGFVKDRDAVLNQV